jgi:hypothetical protein
MANLTPNEPQYARDYDDRSTAAVKSVLVEMGQILGSFQGKFAVVGGAVPWLLLDNVEMPHVGTIDIDLGLDAEALQGGEYVDLVEALRTKGYDQSAVKKFQLVRTTKDIDGNPIQVNIDFLMPREAEIEKNKPPILDDFAVQRADGAELALRFNQLVAVRAAMPETFVNGIELKEDLQKLDQHYSSMPDDVRKQGLWTFALVPPEDTNFLITRLWDQIPSSLASA